MPSTKQLQRQFNAVQDVRQPVRKKYHALVGHPDGTTIQDPEAAGFVFVRINGSEDRVERALCRKVLQRYNQPVIVAYSDELPRTLEVVDLDVSAFAPQSGGSSWDGSPQLGAHAGQHALYGGDTVWIQTKQVLPLRVRPQEPNSMRVYVESGPYQYKLGFNYWPGGYSSDMTAQVPGAGLQLYRIIYINASTNVLAYINSGTMAIDPYLADFESLLDSIPTDSVPLAAIRLYNGMTTITEQNIYDLRSFVSSAPGTAGSRMIWDNVIVVSPSGGDYATITTALAAITDASSSNRYIVLIAPGNYGENITAKPYVSFIGLSRQECIVTAQGTGNAITIPTTVGDYYISDLKVTGPANTSGIVMTGAAPGLVYIDRCDIVSPNAVVMASTDAAGLMTLRDCEITGGGSGVLIGNSQNGHLTLIDCQAVSSGFYCIQQANTPTLIISGGYYSATQAIDWSNGSTITLRNFPVLVGTITGTGTTTMTGAYLDSGGVAKLTNGATAASGTFIRALTNGPTGGFQAGVTSDVLWHRHASTADVWVTPDSVQIGSPTAGTLGIGTAPISTTGLRGDFTANSTVTAINATFYTVTINGATNTARGAYYGVVTTDAVFTLGEAIGVHIDSLDKGAASTVTTNYGLKVENQTAGGTNYAIYTGTGLVRFGDAVTATTLSLTATSNQIVLQSAGVTGTLTWTPATSNKVITLPNLTGNLTLGAGTLTVSTANSVTVADHTHAITTSSNPGAAAAILASTADGYLQLTRIGIGTNAGSNVAINVAPALSNATVVYGQVLTPSVALTTGLAINNIARMDVAANQAVTTLYQFYIGSSILGSGASIGTQYGLFLENITGATTNYGIYVTNAGTYALFIDAGLSRFDGDGTNVFELPADATDPTGGGGAAAGRIPVKIGGVTKYLAYY